MRGFEEPPVDQLIGDYKSPYEVAHGVASILPEDEKRLPYTEKPPLNMVYADLSRGLDESGNIMNPATMEMTDVGMEFADQKFLELMARCDGDFDRARKILGAVENNYTRLDTPHKSAQFNALTRSIQAKIAYNAHLMYANREYGFDQAGQNVYKFLQDKRIAPEDEIYSRASEVLQEKVELYKLAMEKRTGFLNRQNAALVEETGKSPGVLERVRRFAEKFTPTRKKLVYGAVVLSLIAASGMAYQSREDLAQYTNNAVQTIVQMQNPPEPQATMDQQPIRTPTRSIQETVVQNVEVSSPQEKVRGIYSRRIESLISSGCYQVKPYIAKSGTLTYQIGYDTGVELSEVTMANVLVPGNRYGSEVCESLREVPDEEVPPKKGDDYNYERHRSQFDADRATFAYAIRPGGDLVVYPEQIGGTCYVDTYSIALSHLAALHGVSDSGVVIDPQVFMDMMPYHEGDFRFMRSDYQTLAIETFNSAIQDVDGSASINFRRMMEEYWGLKIDGFNLYQYIRNPEGDSVRRYLNDSTLSSMLSNTEKTIDNSRVLNHEEAVKKFEDLLLDVYRNPENRGKTLSFSSMVGRYDPDVPGSAPGLHRFYIQGVIENTNWKPDSEDEEPRLLLQLLEGNGGLAATSVNFNIFNKYAEAEPDGSIVVPVGPELIRYMTGEIEVLTLDPDKFASAIEQIKEAAGVHEIATAPDDALVPGQN